MAGMSDIRDKFGFVSPGRVEEYLGNHPQLIDPLIMAVPVIKRHLPESGTPQLNDGWMKEDKFKEGLRCSRQ
jgi:hypothetical protein